METLDRWQKKEWSPGDVARAVVVGLVILMVVVGFFTSWYTVAPEEEAVILRFGKYHETTKSGGHFKLPFGIDAAHKVAVTEIRKLEFGFRTEEAGRRTSYSPRGFDEEALMLTGDLNIAHVEWVVQYIIKDAKAWIFKVREREDTIRDLSESVMRAVVGDHTVTEVLTRERDKIATQAERALQERLDYYEMGVHVTTVKLQNANPPAQVQKSFNEVNAAQQERSKLENEAQREYNKVIELAKGDAQREVSEARGYATDRVNRALGDVARFKEILKAYSDSKAVTRRRLYLETIEKVLPNVKRVLVVGEEGVLKFLPIEEGGK